MPYSVTYVATRPSTKVPFYGGYVAAHPNSAGAKAKATIEAARKALGVVEDIKTSGDGLSTVAVFTWKDKAEYDKFQADNAETIKTVLATRKEYTASVGIREETIFSIEPAVTAVSAAKPTAV